MYGSILRMQSL